MRLLDFFFLTRPTLIFVVWIFILVGVRGGLDATSTTDLSLLLLQYFCVFASAFIINQLHDLEGDRGNEKLPTLAEGLVSEQEATVFAWALFLLGLAIAWQIGLQNLLLTLLFYTLTGVLYNKPPLATKDRPLLGPLTLALAYTILVWQGASLAGFRHFLVSILDGLPIILSGLSISLLAMIPDLKGDRAAAKKTFPLTYGIDKTWLAALALFACAALIAFLHGDWQLGIPAAFSALLSFGGMLRDPKGSAEIVAKLGILAQAVFLLGDFPFMGILIPLYYYGARAYHKKRFNMDYPSLDFGKK